jgi:hypothetical protein
MTTTARTSRSASTRVLGLLTAVLLLLGTMPSSADADAHPDFSQPHAHALLLHATTVPNPGPGPIAFPIAYERCVDLAGGNALPANNHHRTLHTGNAGGAVAGAGHLVVPFSCGDGVDGYVALVRDALGLDD